MIEPEFQETKDSSTWVEDKLPRAIRPYRSKPFRTVAKLAFIVILASILGVGSAYLVIEREDPFNAITLGAWKAYPKAGTAEANPYSVAIYTRGVVIPLASGEGLLLVAREDSAGNDLDPRCRYLISGQTPAARLWTLTSTDDNRRLTRTLSDRNYLSSSAILRNPDGSFEIIADRSARSGNWLPLAAAPKEDQGLRFMMRLYDAPVSTGAATEGLSMPKIEKQACS